MKRIGLLLVVLTALLAGSELTGAPRLTIQSPTGLYLLAQYKLAVGDTNSGLELLDRALEAPQSQPARAATLHACNIAAGFTSP